MRARMPKQERHISKREMNMAIEIFLRIAMLVLIEDLDFGTRAQKGKELKLQKFIRCFEQKADYMNITFGQEMLDGMNARLQMHGVILEDVRKLGAQQHNH